MVLTLLALLSNEWLHLEPLQESQILYPQRESMALLDRHLASFSMEATLLLGSLAIACSFQLWPSLLGATWLPWINRSGAIAGLSIGLLVVLLTEPIGQKLTGGALPWGVWPWNVHSAVWGMFFNIVICMIISLMATNDPEKEHRQTFHNFFKKHSDIKSSDRWSKPVGALLLISLCF